MKNKQTENQKIANIIVELIEIDILDRGGLGDQWEQIDDDTQKEIRTSWKKMIVTTLDSEDARL